MIGLLMSIGFLWVATTIGGGVGFLIGVVILILIAKD